MQRLLLVAALALGSSLAYASSGLFYFGAGVTSNNVSYTDQQGFASYLGDIDHSTSWQVFAGFRPINVFAVEADYVDLGSHAKSVFTPMSCVDVGSCSITRDSDAKAFAGYAVGFLPIPLPNLDVYGKVGIASYKLNDTVTYYNGLGVPIYAPAYPENGGAFTWGAGIQAHVGIIGARLEYEGFSKASTSVFSLSVYLNLL